MFVQGILARESVLFVVVTVDLNQTVCYQLRQPFGDVVCLYQDKESPPNLLRQSFVRKCMVFEQTF